MTVRLAFKKLDPDAVIPSYKSTGAAGFDLTALEDVYIYPGHTALVRTGLAVEVPEGFELQVRPRSGLSLTTKLRVGNSPGTIDSDYRGEIKVILENTDFIGSHTIPTMVKKGDRIAQGVLIGLPKVIIVEEDTLSDTERGDKGFGSTGLKTNI